MAARKRTTKKRPTRTTAAQKTSRRVKAGIRATERGIEKLSKDVPSTLNEYSRRVVAQLSKLERRIHGAQTAYRRRGTRVLREASRELGRLEARGERNWRKLNTRARRQALKTLRQIERLIEPAPRKKTKRPSAARRGTIKVQEALLETATAINP